MAGFFISKDWSVAIVSNVIRTTLHIKNNVPVNPFSTTALKVIDDIVGIAFAGKPGAVSRAGSRNCAANSPSSLAEYSIV